MSAVHVDSVKSDFGNFEVFLIRSRQFKLDRQHCMDRGMLSPDKNLSNALINMSKNNLIHTLRRMDSNVSLLIYAFACEALKLTSYGCSNLHL